ncbi:MAG TPA: hypothetical protein VGR31_17025 [Planctomycetota bacterium]|jgi:hypothetical protein|nr:hypothetical protein [Planctomycetota bacterium]
MKSQLGIVAIAVAALVCGLASSQNTPVQDPAVQRADKLEKDLAATRLRVEALSAEVADMKKQTAGTLAYLESTAKSAAQMAAVLDESEKAGFTYGLNPDSRHILLRGWRDYLASLQKDVPQADAPPPPPAPVKPAAKPPAKTTVKSGG